MLFKWSDSEHTKHKMLKYLNTKNKNKLFVYLRQYHHDTPNGQKLGR